METAKQARSLPLIRMGETDFYVDSRLGEFREVNAPWNCIVMDEIGVTADNATEIVFDCRTNNVCADIIDPENIPAYIIMVIVPPLVDLDPVGLARKQGLSDNTYIKKQTGRQAPEIKKVHKHRGRRL